MNLINRCSAGVPSYPHLAFVVDKPLVSHFFLLLQQGVVVRCCTGCNVSTFLREELKAGEETIEKIQSIILDGKPVDDLETALIQDGSAIALSAAMPGLVGATLRRGGSYSSFRSAITYHETGETCVRGEGCVRIKLFNLLMSELGPGLLLRGVLLRSEDFLNFTAGLSQDFWQGCRRTTLDNKPVDVRQLQDAAWLSGKDRVVLSVSSGEVKG
jgi:hypothetical protein